MWNRGPSGKLFATVRVWRSEARAHSPVSHFPALYNSLFLSFHLLSGLFKPTGRTGGRGTAGGNKDEREVKEKEERGMRRDKNK